MPKSLLVKQSDLFPVREFRAQDHGAVSGSAADEIFFAQLLEGPGNSRARGPELTGDLGFAGKKITFPVPFFRDLPSDVFVDDLVFFLHETLMNCEKPR